MRMGTKKAVNLSIDSELLDHARRLGVNLSRELEMRLEQLTKTDRWTRWQQENREAMEDHNRRIRNHGLWSDGLRRF